MTMRPELDPAQAVEACWQRLPVAWRRRQRLHEARYPGRPYPEIVALIEAAGADPALRQLYPFTSHFTLNLSSVTSYPWSVRAPAVDPLDDGRFRVRRPGTPRVIGFARTAEAAVGLVVGHLPAGLGPAVAHDPADRRR